MGRDRARSRGLAGSALTLVLQTFTLQHAPAVAAPTIWSSPLLAFAAMAISFLISYQVIAFVTAPRSSPSTKRSSALGSAQAQADDWYDLPTGADTALSGTGLSYVVARTQQAVAQSCIDVSRSPADQMSGRVVDALTELGNCVYSLQHSTSSDSKVRAELDRLVDGLNRFQTSLTQIAADAAATGTQHMYQRGWVFGSMADVSDGGGLARYELDHADGLAAIRESFARLRTLGVGTEQNDS